MNLCNFVFILKTLEFFEVLEMIDTTTFTSSLLHIAAPFHDDLIELSTWLWRSNLLLVAIVLQFILCPLASLGWICAFFWGGIIWLDFNHLQSSFYLWGNWWVYTQLLEWLWLWFGPTFNHKYNIFHLHTTTLVVEECIWHQWWSPLLVQSVEWRQIFHNF